MLKFWRNEKTNKEILEGYVRMYDMYSIKPLNETLKKIKEDLEEKSSPNENVKQEEEEEANEFDEETKSYKKIDISKKYTDFLKIKRGRSSGSNWENFI